MSLIDLARLLMAPTADPSAPGRCCAETAEDDDADYDPEEAVTPPPTTMNHVYVLSPSMSLLLSAASIYLLVLAFTDLLSAGRWWALWWLDRFGTTYTVIPVGGWQ